MGIERANQFLAARMEQRIRDLAGDRMLGNGTPLADALAVAIAEDHALCRSATPLPPLSDEKLLEIYTDFASATSEGGTAYFTLPSGREVRCRDGGIRIGRQDYVLDVARSGLHPIETVRRDAHGPNLIRLQELIARKTRKLACRRLGLPKPYSIAEIDLRQYLLFDPCAEAGGVSLWRGAGETGAERFCSATPAQLNAFANEIVADMRAFWKRRREIAAKAADIRDVVARELATLEGGSEAVTLTALAIEMSERHFDEELSFYPIYDALDEALRRGPMLDYLWYQDCERYSPQFALSGREKDRDGLRAVGADGRITDLAAAILEVAPEGRTAVLARLTSSYEALVTLSTPRGSLYAILFWRDGTIKAELSGSDGMFARNDVFEAWNTGIEGEGEAAVGRKLDEVLDLPFAYPRDVLRAGSLTPDGHRFVVSTEEMLVNLATGRVWTKPQRV